MPDQKWQVVRKDEIENKEKTVMTTHVVADGITAKRKPAVDEMETLLVNRIPDLIRRYKEGGLDPAGVNATLQMVLEGVIITEQKTVVVTVPKPKADKFELLTTFEVTVPEGYNHATRLDTFKAADVNYGRATTKLVPGRKFQVKVFGIRRGKSVTSDECLHKVRSENGVLVGAQGASLAYEQGKANLPKGKWHVSFDEKEALWYGDGYHRVPCVLAYSDGGFEFYLGYFEFDWRDDHCLLCFCDLPVGETQPLDA